MKIHPIPCIWHAVATAPSSLDFNHFFTTFYGCDKKSILVAKKVFLVKKSLIF